MRIKCERRVNYYNQHKTWEGYESESDTDILRDESSDSPQDDRGGWYKDW